MPLLIHIKNNIFALKVFRILLKAKLMILIKILVSYIIILSPFFL